MNYLKSIVFALSLGIFSVSAIAKTSSSEVKNINVQFKQNAYSATYKGKISGYGYDQYHLKAKKGQLLKITATSASKNMGVYLFNKELPDSVDLSTGSLSLDTNGNYVLPHSGAYQIRILQPRAFARRGEKFSYVIQVSIH
ncbi:hypothetical protein [Iodobacter ciconiae]|uniref:Inhibitor of g-type lysozyme n=1 Tax=Iodobacter ciconiae TaxID=2496266 RepID=A0A3S8ZT34_9NEIS|nr:hypothetical protein [Iodobacter ciconiae]AZN36614.1 hypothetical protein EJO50_08960 [Iodobacter ciconiae]